MNTKKIVPGFAIGALLIAMNFNFQSSTGEASSGSLFSLRGVEAFASSGTCCVRAESTCIIAGDAGMDDIVFPDYYLVGEGTCPEE